MESKDQENTLEASEAQNVQKINFTAQSTHTPAGFWIRFAASIIDGFFVGIIKAPLTIGLTFIGIYFLENKEGAIYIITQIISVLIAWGITFFIFAWFNKNKGGSPGKLLLKMKVLDFNTGQYIGYGQTAKRLILGKTILNTLTLGIGYIAAGVRSDKRGLHDLLANTHVVKIK